MAKRTATVRAVCPPGSGGGDALQIEHDGSSYDVTVNPTPTRPTPTPTPTPLPLLLLLLLPLTLTRCPRVW